MNAEALIERIKGVQLRGNTAPEDVFLLDEVRERLRDLEVEVERLNKQYVDLEQERENLHSLFVQHCDAEEAAEAKLAAIEGVQRYVVDDALGIYTTDDDGDWARWPDIRAILGQSPVSDSLRTRIATEIEHLEAVARGEQKANVFVTEDGKLMLANIHSVIDLLKRLLDPEAP